MENKDIIVFISGPVTGHPDYQERFKYAENRLSDLGYVVINPCNFIKFEEVEKLSNENDTGVYDELMKLCYENIDNCDTVFHLKGWENSYGCSAEHCYASIKGKNFLYEEELFGEGTT